MNDDALHKAKLAKLLEIEGYDSIEELMFRLACHLHERRVRLHM
jgi:hypothetical protein